MPDTALATEIEYVDAEMNYVVDDGVPLVMYVDWPERQHEAHMPTYAQHVVRIRNGRPQRDEFRLEVHGFAFVDHHSKMKDFYDSDEVTRVYYPETAALIAKHSGANRVEVFDHTIRAADKGLAEQRQVRRPVLGVHNDYTDQSAQQRLRDILPDESEELMKRRFAIIQVWRPIVAPVEMDPLGICDGRSIPARGFIKLQRRYPYRTAETFHIAYHPDHKWYFFPAMTPDEAVVFKVFDSDPSAGPRFTAHSAFADPTSKPDARPRESIEMRALAFF